MNLTPALAASRRVSLQASAVQVDEVDLAARRVSGMVVPYGEVGYTTAGPVIVPGPGRIEVPADPSRVKLVDEHQTPPVSVGYALSFTDTPQGLRASFYFARTPAGERVMLEMAKDENGGRARDGFSMELGYADLQDNGGPAPVLVAGGLTVVAAVVTPAFDSAREDGLAASHTTTTGRTTSMNRTQRARLFALMNQDTLTTEEAAEMQGLLTLARDNQVALDSLTESGDEPEEEEEEDPEEEEAEEAEGRTQVAASRRPTTTRRRAAAARAPRATGTGRARRTGQHSVADLAAAQARVFRGESRPALEAALSDVTNTANIWTARDDYAGELWGGVAYERRFVPLLQSGPLTSYKGTGWRWVVKPAVADYAGDKAAVTSNQPTTEATEWAAARLAGAHDLDRKFFDFGDSEFIASYYAALTEDYAMKSDDKARLFLLSLAEATGAAGATIYHAAAQAAQAVFDSTNGQSPDYLLVNSADTFDLLNTTAADAPDPRILEMFGVTPDKFMPATGVPAGTVVAGTRMAGRFREMSSSPVRVEALNIANGGVDGGVFGYYATEETFVGGVQSATFAAA